MIGVIGMIMAICAIAFTHAVNTKKTVKTTDYWFLTDGSGNPQPSTTLNTSNPTNCVVSGIGCVGEYSSYTIVAGEYVAAGMLIGDFKESR